MKSFNLCLLGMGGVARALARLLVEKSEELRDEFGIEWRVTGVATRRRGWLVAPEGFDVAELSSSHEAVWSGARASAEIGEWLAASGCDVMFETTPLKPLTGEPAASYLRAALEHGAHVITANKGPVVHAHGELSELAHRRGRRFLYEATVADCLPVFSLFRESFPAARLLGFKGVLNSTTTLILEEMAAGGTFDEGVRRAQSLGVAEADASHDVDGWDATLKVCAVAGVLMKARLSPADVEREGIRALSVGEVRAAAAAGEPYKLVARARLDNRGNVTASVRPERAQVGSPLSLATGTTMLIDFELDVLDGLTVIAHRPDPRSTAYAMLADFINAARG